MIVGLNGEPIAKESVRLVVGGRGTYLEMADEHIFKENIEVEPGQEYRLLPHWRTKAFYGWWRTKLGHYKLYHQYRYVGYADYKIGFWYIDPKNLQLTAPKALKEM